MIPDAKFAEIRKAILYRDIECMADLVDAIKTNTTSHQVVNMEEGNVLRDWTTLLHAAGYQSVPGIKKCHVITMRAGEPGKVLISNLPSPTLLQNIPLSLEIKQRLPVRDEGTRVVVKEPEFLALNPPPTPFRGMKKTKQENIETHIIPFVLPNKRRQWPPLSLGNALLASASAQPLQIESASATPDIEDVVQSLSAEDSACLRADAWKRWWDEQHKPPKRKQPLMLPQTRPSKRQRRAPLFE